MLRGHPIRYGLVVVLGAAATLWVDLEAAQARMVPGEGDLFYRRYRGDDEVEDRGGGQGRGRGKGRGGSDEYGSSGSGGGSGGGHSGGGSNGGKDGDSGKSGGGDHSPSSRDDDDRFGK